MNKQNQPLITAGCCQDNPINRTFLSKKATFCFETPLPVIEERMSTSNKNEEALNDLSSRSCQTSLSTSSSRFYIPGINGKATWYEEMEEDSEHSCRSLYHTPSDLSIRSAPTTPSTQKSKKSKNKNKKDNKRTGKGNDEVDDPQVEKASKNEKATKTKKARKARKSRSQNELQENKEERSVRSTKSSRKRKSKETKKSKKEGDETVLLSPTMQNATFDEFGNAHMKVASDLYAAATLLQRARSTVESNDLHKAPLEQRATPGQWTAQQFLELLRKEAILQDTW